MPRSIVTRVEPSVAGSRPSRRQLAALADKRELALALAEERVHASLAAEAAALVIQRHFRKDTAARLRHGDKDTAARLRIGDSADALVLQEAGAEPIWVHGRVGHGNTISVDAKTLDYVFLAPPFSKTENWVAALEVGSELEVALSLPRGQRFALATVVGKREGAVEVEVEVPANCAPQALELLDTIPPVHARPAGVLCDALPPPTNERAASLVGAAPPAPPPLPGAKSTHKILISTVATPTVVLNQSATILAKENPRLLSHTIIKLTDYSWNHTDDVSDPTEVLAASSRAPAQGQGALFAELRSKVQSKAAGRKLPAMILDYNEMIDRFIVAREDGPGNYQTRALNLKGGVPFEVCTPASSLSLSVCSPLGTHLWRCGICMDWEQRGSGECKLSRSQTHAHPFDFCQGCVVTHAETAVADGKLFVTCPCLDCRNHFEMKQLKQLLNLERYNTLMVDLKDAEDQAFALDIEADPQLVAWLGDSAEGGVRQCPKCGVVTEKNGGCDHIACGRCGHDWHWSKVAVHPRLVAAAKDKAARDAAAAVAAEAAADVARLSAELEALPAVDAPPFAGQGSVTAQLRRGQPNSQQVGSRARSLVMRPRIASN